MTGDAMPQTNIFYVSTQGQITRMQTLSEAQSATTDGGYIWLDYRQPTSEILSVLCDELGLHPLSIEDCVDSNQVPKMDDFPGYSFVIFNAYSYSHNKLSIDEIDIFLGETFLITVSEYGSETRQPLEQIQRIVELNAQSIKFGPAFLMHEILDYVVDQKFIAIEALEDELEAAEEEMLASPDSFNPAKMLRLRRELLAVRKSLFHEREILVKICRNDCPYISDAAIFHYRDVYDHLSKFFEITEAFRDIVTSLMELHTSMLSNLMAKSANATNATVRRLTFITTIFMPLTLLSGIGGMSEYSMMTGSENWKIAYPAFLLAMVLIGTGTYYLLKRLDKK